MALGHAAHAERLPRDESRIARFELHGANGGASVLGLHGAAPAGRVRASEPGLHAIVYVSTGDLSVLQAAAFDRYLAEEGLDAARDQRRQREEGDQPGREVFFRSIKSLIDVGGRGGPDRPVGIPLELLRERVEPETVTLRLLLEGRPLAGCLVELQPLGGGPSAAERSDAEGRVRLAAGPGEWLATAVHIRRGSSREGADWESLWSSLTFAVPVPEERVGRLDAADRRPGR